MTDPVRKLLIYHLPAIMYAVGVITVSSIPNLKAPTMEFVPIDKVAHILEYALFSLLTFRSFSNLSTAISKRMAVLLSLLFLVAFAALDEYYQSFVPGRSSDNLDLLSNICGACIILTVLWLVQCRKKTGSV